ncbi:hypothetical protein FNV43_RR11000 [Rhamnella rubrinervis]|uniref:Uncharacterized protein n=1 Tax=Rhamnella rubrinervis TaxID=2594499 RepID=A0A8K0MHG2_9ROSA|nr:hypothetical protein FNV43_RR11000 [Rhamnella rubrinervis]
MFNRLSGWVRGKCDPPVEEPVPVRVVTPVRESSIGSYEGRISQRGDSQSIAGYQDVRLYAESSHYEWERGLHTVVRYLTCKTRFIPLPDGGRCYVRSEDYDQHDDDHRHDMTMLYLDQFDENHDEHMVRWAQLDAQGFGGPPDAEEDPEEVVAEDLEEDSMGSDDHVPYSYSPKPVNLEDFDPWDMRRFPRNVHPEPESGSGDATSRLVEAIERLVAQNVQQQQPQQQQQPEEINAVVKQFRDLHPLEFDGSMNPLVAENWIRELEKIFLLTDILETRRCVLPSC